MPKHQGAALWIRMFCIWKLLPRCPSTEGPWGQFPQIDYGLRGNARCRRYTSMSVQRLCTTLQFNAMHSTLMSRTNY